MGVKQNRTGCTVSDFFVSSSLGKIHLFNTFIGVREREREKERKREGGRVSE